MEKKKIMIGEIRGDLGLLKDLLDKIQPTDSDFLLFLGSCIGTGPNSRAVLDYLIELKRQRGDNVGFLLGCYEMMFHSVISGTAYLPEIAGSDLSTVPYGRGNSYAKKRWSDMGGAQVLKSYLNDSPGNVVNIEGVAGKPLKVELEFKIPQSHLAFIEHEMKDWYQDHDYPFIAAHAGVNPLNFLNPQRLETVIQVTVGGTPWWDTDFCIEGTDIVFSHQPFSSPMTRKGKVGIGSMPGYIFAVEYPSKTFFTAGGSRVSSKLA